MVRRETEEEGQEEEEVVRTNGDEYTWWRFSCILTCNQMWFYDFFCVRVVWYCILVFQRSSQRELCQQLREPIMGKFRVQVHRLTFYVVLRIGSPKYTGKILLIYATLLQSSKFEI